MAIDPIIVEIKTPIKPPKFPFIGKRSTKFIIFMATAVIIGSIIIFSIFTALVNNSQYKDSHNIVTPADEITQANGTIANESALPGSSSAKGSSVTSGPDAPQVSLTASPSSVLKGKKTKLTWSVTNNPTSCTASEDWSGDKPATGSAEITLSEFRPYLFILTCKKDNSTGYSKVSVGVSEPTPASNSEPAKGNAPVVTLAADNAFVYTGQSVMLSWSATNSPNACTASGDWSGTKNGSGSVSSGPLNNLKTYTFTLSCANSSGDGTPISTKVTVTNPPPDVPAVSISSNPAGTVTPGTAVTLNWNAINNPSSCTASGDWSGQKPATGTASMGALNNVKTYYFSLQCINDAGSVIETATVDVKHNPPAVALTVSPSSIIAGGAATITWSATNSPTSCMASGDWSGAKSSSGSVSTGSLNSVKTYRYSISCTNSGGTGYANNVPLTVSAQSVPVVTLSANPILITAGGSSNLSWSVTNSPSSCTASGDWSGTKTSSGSSSTGVLSTVKTYSYTLSCTNGGGSSSATTTVAVSSGAPAVTKPLITLSASPTTIGTGSSSTISWTSTNNPTSCTASGSWTGSKAGSGSTSTGSITTAGTKTYTLVCSNSAGSDTKSVTITVIAIPIVTITLNPNSINTGGSSAITWSATNSPSSCTAGGSWSGSKASSGSQSTGAISTAGTYTYSISCTNAGGTGSNSASLTVNNAAVVYCGGLTPCYGPSTLAQHATTSNCWSYQTANGTSVLYNMTNFAPSHSGGASTITTAASCGRAISWTGAPSNGKHTAAKSNTQSTLNAYRVGYYDAAQP